MDELWVRGHRGGEEAFEARDVDGGADSELLDAAPAVELPGDEQREREPAKGDRQREELRRGAKWGCERLGRPLGDRKDATDRAREEGPLHRRRLLESGRPGASEVVTPRGSNEVS